MSEPRPSHWLLQLEAVKQLVIYREREFQLAQAKASSFICEYDLLQQMPAAERPANYSEILTHIDANIRHFRERFELCEERYVQARQKLHHQLVTLVRRFPGANQIYAQCVKIIQLPMPEPTLPGDEIETQQDLMLWLAQTLRWLQQEELLAATELERLGWLVELELDK